ncbi:MAG TPA: oxidoreductase [Clostridiales bacterium]|jgi:2-oxoglutarate ferredoxin oxidoreductase subunit gamma|nr:oxidoreductase [Clostridiales bacterium]
MTGIICSGFGGQGVLTMGLILANTAMLAGNEVTWIPSYGAEMRGGTANCSIKISDEPIASPYVNKIDVLIAMNEPSLKKFENDVVPGGMIIVNTSIVKEKVGRSDVKIVEINANDIAVELNNPRAVNLIVLGTFVGATGVLTKDDMSNGIVKYFEKKKIDNTLNLKAYEEGFAVGEAQKG